MLLHLALSVSASATPVLVVAPPPPRAPRAPAEGPPVAEGFADEAPDCHLTEGDYYALRDRIRELRRGEGTTIGIAAEGAQCQRALDAVVRNGPFLGVRRVENDIDGPYHEQCIAVVRPGPGGFEVVREGVCLADDSGPSRMISVGYWLPLGGSIRLNEDMGRGLSGVADFGWQAPDIGVDPFDLGDTVPKSGNDSRMRGLLGFDVARNGLMGTYLGFRAGIEWTTPAVEKATASNGIAEFVIGHKWMSNGIGAQVGGGLLAMMPLGLGPQPELLYPMAELRIGGTNRR